MAKVTFIACALLCFLLSLTSTGEAKPASPSGCCTKYVPNPLPVEKIVSYTVTRPGRCRLPAVRFTMVVGKVFCANPDEKWVQDAMAFIQKVKLEA